MQIYFLGDIHRGFYTITDFINNNDITDASIIQVGDFGVGFFKYERDYNDLSKLNDELAKRNISLFAIRGNHDYPEYFKNDVFSLSNIILVPDYTVLEIGEQKILCVGGAISIDKNKIMTERQKNGNFTPNIGIDEWWADEGFVYKAEVFNGITILVTHQTGSDFTKPHNMDEVNQESQLIQKFINELKESNPTLTHHFWGHHHYPKIAYVDNIRCQQLASNEFYLLP